MKKNELKRLALVLMLTTIIQLAVSGTDTNLINLIVYVFIADFLTPKTID